MVQKVARRLCVQGWALPSEGLKTRFINPAVNGNLFLNPERIRQRKDRDGLCLSLTLNPSAPSAIRLWETFTLPF